MHNYMYNIFLEVIKSGEYELTEQLVNLDFAWAHNKINHNEYLELVELARKNADPTKSVNILKQLDQIMINLQGLTKRIENLEKKDTTKPSIPQDNYPAFELHHPYINGEKVTFEGKKYICTLPEHTTTTTWSPKDYPPYWTLVEEKTI